MLSLWLPLKYLVAPAVQCVTMLCTSLSLLMRSFLCTFCRVLSVFGPFFCECVNPWSLLVFIFALGLYPLFGTPLYFARSKGFVQLGLILWRMVSSYSVSSLLLRKISPTLSKIYQSFFLVGVIKYRDYALLRVWDKAVGLFLMYHAVRCIKGIWAKIVGYLPILFTVCRVTKESWYRATS